eukprot:scaffold8638_cov159-Alexandrium_tamarense.AAC.1
MFNLLDAPVMRLSMDDAPVPYASAMEKVVVKRGADLVDGVLKMCDGKCTLYCYCTVTVLGIDFLTPIRNKERQDL